MQPVTCVCTFHAACKLRMNRHTGVCDASALQPSVRRTGRSCRSHFFLVRFGSLTRSENVVVSVGVSHSFNTGWLFCTCV
jgi:hypothetical protein